MPDEPKPVAVRAFFIFQKNFLSFHNSFFVVIPWIATLGIAREPPAFHASFLMKHFEYAPKARETCDAEQCRDKHIINED